MTGRDADDERVCGMERVLEKLEGKYGETKRRCGVMWLWLKGRWYWYGLSYHYGDKMGIFGRGRRIWQTQELGGNLNTLKKKRFIFKNRKKKLLFQKVSDFQIYFEVEKNFWELGKKNFFLKIRIFLKKLKMAGISEISEKKFFFRNFELYIFFPSFWILDLF